MSIPTHNNVLLTVTNAVLSASLNAQDLYRRVDSDWLLDVFIIHQLENGKKKSGSDSSDIL